ncbi:MAG: murein biosynthesis integral membrane protein MurJ [Phycisphaeraceae bacterium]|nr:MAG: murein biosynthesis integral membrane protein MurJ [Phycisphaeraceae bacterium]
MNPSHAGSNPSSTGRDVRTVSGLTILSRCFGLARDLVTVRIFGDTAVGSAFAAAFAIPNLFRRLFGEGALSAAFLPAYARLLKNEPETAHALGSLVIGMLAVITGAIAILGGAALLGLVYTLAPDPDRDLSLRLIVVMLPYMPLICVAAILGGMLQAHGRFAPWAAAPIILNTCILAAAVPFFLFGGADPARWAYFIGYAVVVAGVVQLAWSLWMLRGRAAWTTRVASAKSETFAMFRRMLPALIGLGTLQLNAMLDTLIAMWPNWVGPSMLGHRYPLDEASNSILFYAQRLYQFPLGVFGIAVATVIFPELARASDDGSAFVRTLRHGVRLSLFIALPASVGLALVRDDLIRTVYTGLGTGFSEPGAVRAAAVVLGYSVAIWSYSLMHVYTRAFYAAGDTRTPMYTGLAAVGLNLVLNLTLIWFLREAGLAWSTAIASIVQMVMLGRIARRRLLGEPLLDSETRASIVRTIGTSLAMGLAVAAVVVFWPARGSWGARASALVVAVVAGGAVYAGVSRFVRAPELGWLLARHDPELEGPDA